MTFSITPNYIAAYVMHSIQCDVEMMEISMSYFKYRDVITNNYLLTFSNVKVNKKIKSTHLIEKQIRISVLRLRFLNVF